MAIAALYNIPGTQEEFLQWTFAHAAHHTDIVQAIYTQQQIALPIFQLDPFDPRDPTGSETWAYLHQLMHQNQNAVLGINGFDLTSIDWHDQNQVAAWIQLNAAEHLEAANLLGVG
jgi:hypothetical protein